MTQPMQPRSNPVRRELAKARPSDPHLDDDVLAAFGEGTLLHRERAKVMEHLAGCEYCRELFSVSASAAPERTAEQPGRSRVVPNRLWIPRVAAVALCAASIVAVVVVQKRNGGPRNTSVARVEKFEAPAPPAAAAPAERRRTEKPAQAAPEKTVVTQSKATPFPRPESMPPARVDSRKSAESEVAESIAKQPAATALQSNTPARAAGLVSSGANAQTAPFASNEVARAPAELHGSLPKESTRAAAEPAFTDALKGSAGVSRPHWRISADGHIERQIGTGPWDVVLAQEHANIRAITVVGNSVWAGGDEQRLYRSTDNGNTWMAIVLPIKGGVERSIAHIRFTTQLAGTIEAEDGTQWRTTDGGVTWH